MKKYDREKREWVSEEEYARRVKKREKCKGGSNHEYVEVLPWGVEAGEGYAGDPQPFYDAQKEVRDFEDAVLLRLAGIGIISKPAYRSRYDYRVFACTKCRKQTTKYA